jgi:hypothetical protein
MSLKIKSGEIRKIDSIEGASGRLGLILAIDNPSGSVIVGLLSNMIEVATLFDLILDSGLTNAPYDLVLLTDFVGRVEERQLRSNKVIGAVSEDFISKFLEARSTQGFDVISLPEAKNGSFPMQENDAVWDWRKNEFDNWSKLTYRKSRNSSRHSEASLEAHLEEPTLETIEELTEDATRILVGRF